MGRNKKVIEFSRFSNLTTENKLKVLSEDGVLICSRTYAKTKVSLYSLGKYYAEVWFNRNTDDISNVLPFTTIRCLKVYMDMINVEDILVGLRPGIPITFPNRA